MMKDAVKVNVEFRRAYFVLAIAVSFLNLGLAETERPQLLTRSFDRELLVKTSVLITTIYMTFIFNQNLLLNVH